MLFTITGKVKPYVRMTQRSKFANPQAIQYLASKEAIAWQFKTAMAADVHAFWAAEVPLRVDIVFNVPNRKNTCDIDNLIKAIFDAGNGIVWPDDRWIDAVSARRRLSDDHITTVEVHYV